MSSFLQSYGEVHFFKSVVLSIRPQCDPAYTTSRHDYIGAVIYQPPSQPRIRMAGMCKRTVNRAPIAGDGKVRHNSHSSMSPL